MARLRHLSPPARSSQRIAADKDAPQQKSVSPTARKTRTSARGRGRGRARGRALSASPTQTRQAAVRARRGESPLVERPATPSSSSSPTSRMLGAVGGSAIRPSTVFTLGPNAPGAAKGRRGPARALDFRTSGALTEGDDFGDAYSDDSGDAYSDDSGDASSDLDARIPARQLERLLRDHYELKRIREMGALEGQPSGRRRAEGRASSKSKTAAADRDRSPETYFASRANQRAASRPLMRFRAPGDAEAPARERASPARRGRRATRDTSPARPRAPVAEEGRAAAPYVRNLGRRDMRDVAEFLEANAADQIILNTAEICTEEEDRRLRRIPWTAQEMDALVLGEKRHGPNWRAILDDATLPFHPARTNVDLKDKWRNMHAARRRADLRVRPYVFVDENHALVRREGSAEPVTFLNKWPCEAALKAATRDAFYASPSDTEGEVRIREGVTAHSYAPGAAPLPLVVHVYRIWRERVPAPEHMRERGVRHMWEGHVRKIKEERFLRPDDVLKMQAQARSATSVR